MLSASQPASERANILSIHTQWAFVVSQQKSTNFSLAKFSQLQLALALFFENGLKYVFFWFSSRQISTIFRERPQISLLGSSSM